MPSLPSSRCSSCLIPQHNVMCPTFYTPHLQQQQHAWRTSNQRRTAVRSSSSVRQPLPGSTGGPPPLPPPSAKPAPPPVIHTASFLEQTQQLSVPPLSTAEEDEQQQQQLGGASSSSNSPGAIVWALSKYVRWLVGWLVGSISAAELLLDCCSCPRFACCTATTPHRCGAGRGPALSPLACTTLPPLAVSLSPPLCPSDPL